MLEHGKKTWMAKILYCDSKTVETYVFTEDSAREIIDEILKKPKIPTVCEYCSYCALRSTCEAYNSEANKALAVKDNFQNVLSDPVKLEDFIVASKFLEKYIEDAKNKALELYDSGHKFEKIKIVERKGSEKVVIDSNLAEQIKTLSAESIIDLIKITTKQANDLGIKYDTYLTPSTRYIKI